MKRFRFPQESLLQVKRQLKSQAELKVRKAQGRLSRAIERRNQLQDEMEQLKLPPEQQVSQVPANQPRDVWHWVAASQHLQRQLRESQQIVEHLERERAACVARLRKAEAEVESLETLRDRQLALHRKDQAHRQDQTLDETAIRGWMIDKNLALKGDSHD